MRLVDGITFHISRRLKSQVFMMKSNLFFPPRPSPELPHNACSDFRSSRFSAVHQEELEDKRPMRSPKNISGWYSVNRQSARLGMGSTCWCCIPIGKYTGVIQSCTIFCIQYYAAYTSTNTYTFHAYVSMSRV